MANKDAARTKIAQGLESLRQGKGLDGEAIMAKLLEQIRHTPAEAATRILELRKGNILPEGETMTGFCCKTAGLSNRGSFYAKVRNAT